MQKRRLGKLRQEEAKLSSFVFSAFGEKKLPSSSQIGGGGGGGGEFEIFCRYPETNAKKVMIVAIYVKR